MRGGHKCQPWQICSACRGRIHRNDCKAKMRPAVDCCPARHKQLHEAGHVRGLDDSALEMWKGGER